MVRRLLKPDPSGLRLATKNPIVLLMATRDLRYLEMVGLSACPHVIAKLAYLLRSEI